MNKGGVVKLLIKKSFITLLTFWVGFVLSFTPIVGGELGIIKKIEPAYATSAKCQNVPSPAIDDAAKATYQYCLNPEGKISGQVKEQTSDKVKIILSWSAPPAYEEFTYTDTTVNQEKYKFDKYLVKIIEDGVHKGTIFEKDIVVGAGGKGGATHDFTRPKSGKVRLEYLVETYYKATSSSLTQSASKTSGALEVSAAGNPEPTTGTREPQITVTAKSYTKDSGVFSVTFRLNEPSAGTPDSQYEIYVWDGASPTIGSPTERAEKTAGNPPSLLTAALTSPIAPGTSKTFKLAVKAIYFLNSSDGWSKTKLFTYSVPPEATGGGGAGGDPVDGGSGDEEPPSTPEPTKPFDPEAYKASKSSSSGGENKEDCGCNKAFDTGAITGLGELWKVAMKLLCTILCGIAKVVLRLNEFLVEDVIGPSIPVD